MNVDLIEFIDAVHQNSRGFLANDVAAHRLLQDISGAFSEALVIPELQQHSPLVFVPMSHASYLAAVQLATSGQLPPSYMASRGCLEAAIYGWWVNHKPELKEIWSNQDDSPQAKKALKNSFKMVHMLDALRQQHEGVEKQFGTAYETTISLGAHPNSMAFWTNLGDPDAEGGQPYMCVNPDPASVNQAVHTAAFSALTALFVLSFAFEKAFETVRLRPKAAVLLQRLFARFPDGPAV